MFKKLTTAAVLTASCFAATSTQANEVSLEQFVTAMLSQAMANTKQELSLNVQEAVLTANNLLSFEEAETYATKVTITDLDSTEAEQDKAE